MGVGEEYWLTPPHKRAAVKKRRTLVRPIVLRDTAVLTYGAFEFGADPDLPGTWQ